MLVEAVQPDQPQRILRQLAKCRFGPALQFRTEGRVPVHRAPRQQAIILEYKGDVLARLGDRAPVDFDTAGCRFRQTVDEAKERGLPATGCADDADEFAVLHVDG